MQFINNLIQKYGKKKVYVGTGVLILIIGAIIYTSVASDTPVVATQEVVQSTVTVQAAGAQSGTQNFSAVGTVSAVSEAKLVTEKSGRVTAVYAGIGDTVYAGKILAQLENSSERASLLQAEGAYDAALVSSVGASISLDEAKVGASNAFRTAFTVSDDIIRNLTDEFFSNPTSQIVGLKLKNDSSSLPLNSERKELEIILDSWKADVDSGKNIDTTKALDTAEKNLSRISGFVSEISILLAEQETSNTFTETDIASYKGRLSVARTRIDGTLESISGARNALLQAEQSATQGAVSSEADARIKQALGGLRAAQSAYEKTIVRSPITGVVNAFYVKANDNVGFATPVAIVANNNALEIATAISDDDRGGITIGDTVLLDQNASGTITRIAPAIDPTTGKVEVRVGVDAQSSFKNGDTVTVGFTRKAEAMTHTESLLVPISAFKITATGPVAFTVDTDSKLVAVPVTLGAIQGESVVVKEGLTAETEIVTDVRGLKAGEIVTVIKK